MPCLRGKEAFWTPRVGPKAGPPWGLLLVLCSTEHSPLSGLLWALSAPFSPAVLAPPRRHSCPGSPWLSFPALAKKHSGAVVGAQKVGLASRSVILRKIARTSSFSSSSSSSSSFGCDRSRSSFFKFSLFRKQGLLGLYSCCPIL